MATTAAVQQPYPTAPTAVVQQPYPMAPTTAVQQPYPLAPTASVQQPYPMASNTVVQQSYPMAANTVVQQPPVIMATFAFGPDPMQVTCGNCHMTVTTTTTWQNGGCACLAVFIVCILCWPCFWLPLVMNSCKDVIHTCPSCGSMLGRYSKL